MAIIDMHGLDNYSTSDDFLEGAMYGTLMYGSATILSGQGRLGGKAMMLDSSSFIYWLMPDSSSSVAFHGKFSALTGTRYIVTGGNSTTSIGMTHFRIYVTTDGAVYVAFEDGTSPVVLFPAGSIVVGEYFYFCASVYSSNTGTISARLNNVTNTVSGDTWRLSTKYMYLPENSGQMVMDDIVITSDTSHYLLPPQVIQYLPPTADTAQADFVPQGGGSGYEEVDDLVEDGEVSYITGTQIGESSEFTVGAVNPVITSITAMNVVGFAKRVGTEGTNGVEISIVTEADNEVSSMIPALSDTGFTTGISSIGTINPDDGAAFEPSDLATTKIKVTIV